MSFLLAAAIMSTTQMTCLAENIYFEARNQTDVGMIAVAHVTINRLEDSRYPDTLCGVVRQGHKKNGQMVRNMCQFSWYCDGLPDKPRDLVAWGHAVDIAYRAAELYNYGFDVTNGATHYHTTNVDPYWASELEKLITIDDHIFYKE